MQLEMLRFIQRFSNPIFDILFELFTMFGEQIPLACLLCAVYWCLDKEFGRYLLCSLCASLCLNGFVKDIVRAPRPIGAEGISSSRVHTATGYSFPSGHTQSAAAFWSGAALWLKRRPVTALSVFMVAGVGVSRLYLGVHYPVDVLGGAAFGVFVSLLFHRIHRRTGNYRLLLRISAIIAACALAAAPSDDTVKAIGMLAGAYIGLPLEERFVGFDTSGTPARKALRLAVGLAMAGALYAVPRLLLPYTAIWSAVRYGCLAFFVTAVYPWISQRLHI